MEGIHLNRGDQAAGSRSRSVRRLPSYCMHGAHQGSYSTKVAMQYCHSTYRIRPHGYSVVWSHNSPPAEHRYRAQPDAGRTEHPQVEGFRLKTLAYSSNYHPFLLPLSLPPSSSSIRHSHLLSIIRKELLRRVYYRVLAVIPALSSTPLGTV